MANCAFHPDRETFRSCSRCGQPACHDCLIDAPVGAQCRSCVRAAKPSTTQTLKANLRNPTLATQLLIGLFVSVFVLGVIQHRGVGVGLGNTVSSLDYLSLTRTSIADGQWWRLFTNGFLHFGLIHVGFSCFALWNIGRGLELTLGRWRFVSLFCVGVLGGSAGALLSSGVNVQTAGAPSGLFGLFAAGYMGSRARRVSFSESGWGPALLMNLALNVFLSLSVGHIMFGGLFGGIAAGAACGYVLLGRRSLIGTKASRDKQDIAVLVGVGLLAVVIALLAAYR
jgi:membrane associated rhomboid family serine protease